MKIWHFFNFLKLNSPHKLIRVKKMKIARLISKTVFFITLTLDIAIFASLIYLNQNIGEDFRIKKGDTLSIDSPLPVTAVYNGSQLTARHTDGAQNQFDVDLKMFGIIPFSTASVQVVDELQVVVLGNPFGMKLYTEGVLVVDMTDIETENSTENPAKKAGIKKGDYVLSVNGESLSTNEDLVDIVENSAGEELTFKILRGKKKFTVKLRAVLSKESGTYKIGLWVRDSSAGIGTLTFYSPTTNVICGLGHGICDEDTGELLKLDTGEIVTAEIFAVEKGESGEPGKLKGRFTEKTLGEIKLNCSGGVYSEFSGDLAISKLIEVALKSDIQNGAAQIYCTVDGTTPRLYDCKVSIKSGNFNSATQNMIVTVTDPVLLEATGGIVQGLSGSPLLQNGKLIGAVTHVLVDDPTKGYAIFAENMLQNAQSVGDGEAPSRLKDAS